MTRVTKGAVGWVAESTYGVRDLTLMYKMFGRMFDPVDMPTEKGEIQTQKIGSSFDYNNFVYTNKGVEFNVPFYVDDAREFYYIFGKNSDGGTSPNYTHTITTIEPADAFTLPSRTVHMQTTGMTTERLIDAAGSLVKEAEFKIAYGDPNGLHGNIKFVGQRITDENATTNLYGDTTGGTADPEGSTGGTGSVALEYASTIAKLTLATAYTNAVSTDIGKTVTDGSKTGILIAYDNDDKIWLVKETSGTFATTDILTITSGTGAGTVTAVDTADTPVRRINNVKESFIFPKSGAANDAIKVGTVDLTSLWKALSFKVVYNYKQGRSQRSGTNNYGVEITNYKQGEYIVDRSYIVTLVLDMADSISSDLLGNIMKEAYSDQLVLTFERSNDSSETLVFTFDSSVTPVEKIEFPMDVVNLSTDYVTLTWRPRSLVSCVKTDDHATLLEG